METSERVAASPQFPADVSQSVGQAPVNHLGAQSHNGARQEPRQPGLEADGWEHRQLWGHSLQPEFQDSNLSPALPLMPANAGVEHMFTEYSLFHHSDNEFAPLRAYPDISMISERTHFSPQDCTSRVSEHGSLSQHPLAQDTILSGSLSQQSLSLEDEGKQKDIFHSPLITTTDKGEVPSRDDTSNREKDSKTVKDLPDRPVGEAADDETFFLSKDVPAQHLLELLQKDIGMPSGSTSPASSASETSAKTAATFSKGCKYTQVSKPAINESSREGPPGEASIPQCQTQQERELHSDQSPTTSSEVCNITMGLRNTQPDDRSEVLHRELLLEVKRRRSCESESQTLQRKSPPPGQSLTPHPSEMSEGKARVTRTKSGGLPRTNFYSTGLVWSHREQDLWSSGNQTGIDGSYLGFLPQSQSTPGIFKAPLKSSVKAKVGQLSAIESKSSTEISQRPTAPVADVQHSDPSNQCKEEATSTAKVQSLPSLSYMQKVDAWRENQTSGKVSLFDSLALHGFSGVSPKRKAYNAVSDSLNHILGQQVRGVQQPPVLDAGNQDVTQSSSSAPSCSSYSRRGEAAGSAPSDNAASATKPSASPAGRSQSHSSLSTVVTSARKDQQTETRAEEEKSQTQDDVPHQPSTAVQPSTLAGLGHFSDVSFDQDLTLSSSQESNNSGIQVGTSVGASSVVSLEVDNYTPHWMSKPLTPPPPLRSEELNIEERIPLYLHNLGIDQSPSTILNPFAPRGPIREPEFSPTELCTVKGSIGTPTKSTQPSEDGSPHKGEFSRSSILSVASSVSIPFSMDSLGPAASAPEWTKLALPSLDTKAVERLNAPSSLPDEDSYPFTLQSALQQQRDSSFTSSQNTSQRGGRFDRSSATEAGCEERDLESPLRTTRSTEQSAETSFASAKAVPQIHKLLSQAEMVESAGSFVPRSASSPAPPPLSDEDPSLSLKKKTSRQQDSSSSSVSSIGDPRPQPAPRWPTSSSDSMLTSEKLRESSIGQENMTSSVQLYNPSTPPFVTAEPTDSHRRPDSTVGGAAGSAFVPSQTARRAEPEGCSAAPPDNTVPPQPPAIQPSPAASTDQFTSPPPDTVEEKPNILEGSAQSSSSLPTLEDTDQGALSDGSSESSLAVRVAKLLQSESPATVVSSTPSIPDQEESKAREWIKLKISGQQCEPLELDKEDRRRIEEIKRELLSTNPIKSQGNTETGSSTASSLGVQRGRDPARQMDTPTDPSDANNQSSQPLQCLTSDPSDSGAQLQNPPRLDLEAMIREIAAREGVALPRTNPRALTSITIATRKRSTSPSPSTSPAASASPAPEPLHMSDFSTGAARHPKAHSPRTAEETSSEPARMSEPGGDLCSRNQTKLSSQSPLGDQKRQETVGGQFEEPPPPSRPSGAEEVNAKGNTRSVRRENSVSAASREADQCTGSPTPESPSRTGQVSHVHLTLSKVADYSTASAAHSDHANPVPREDFVLLRHSSSAATSPDEGAGLSSPAEWYDNGEPVRRRRPERAHAATLFKTIVAREKITPTSSQSFSPSRSVVASPRPLNSGSHAVPVLLPYKPNGSEELFYMPQTEADFSSADPSDTTMESTHTGSDDAAPPPFSSDVLGHRDAGLDRGVTIRHTEGIYSKRLNMAAFKINESEHGAARSSQTPRAPMASPQLPVALGRAPLSSNHEAPKRDQGTGPMRILSHGQLGPTRETVQPVHVQPELPHPSLSSLDRLWERFCSQWRLEETRPTSDREAPLLERLERLSRLLHSTEQERGGAAAGSGRRKNMGEARRSVGEARGGERTDGGGRKVEGEPPIRREARTQRLQAEEDSLTSGLSHESPPGPHLCPADRDESEAPSTTSGSTSTVDTARLVRAFGAYRVQRLKTRAGLGKLYRTIGRQKDGQEQGRGRSKEPLHLLTPSETGVSEESMVSGDSASSTNTYTLPSHHGPSRTLEAKKAVKLVHKGIQAGDLELVCNGTRRHTRDVGTTFPSPGEARTSRRTSSSSSSLERRGKGTRRSPPKAYPEGISWFISAAELRSEARKENRPEEEEWRWRTSNAWFEPYSRIKPWREPLRQRQIPEEGNQQPRFTHQVEPEIEARAKTVSSGLTRMSLQEALEARRPEFISKSRQRLRRLALQAEERKLQEVFTREREELFSRPGGPGRLPKPAGTALLRRAVPRKEMIQRSKQIYESLPEVQRRKEEERRKAEYRSYRVNAQLYNKRITSRVLGRRTAWQ